MFNMIRQRVRRLAGQADDLRRARDAHMHVRLPNPYGGAPWVTATLALSSTPHGLGETVRLRAHIDGCLRLPTTGNVSGRLLSGHEERGSVLRQGQDAAAAVVRGILAWAPAERIERLTGRRWRSWLDVQLCTAPLDAGADALTPEPLRGVYGSGLPRSSAGEPRVGVWSGPAGGPAGGIAHLALVQLDERDLVGKRRPGAASGFSLNASIAQLVEPDTGSDSSR